MRMAVIFNVNRPDTWGIYVVRALRSLGHEVTHCAFDEAGRLGPGFDLYVRMDDGDGYELGLPPACRPAVYWISDTHLEGPMRKLCGGARQYDLVCCAMLRGTERLRAAGVSAEWIGGGAIDPEIHRRLDVDRTYDVGFVGTDGGSPRKFYLQMLRERYPNSFIGSASHERLGEVYSRSKIGFNFCPTQDSMTMRCFEIMASGALLVLNDVPGNTHRDLGVTPGTHCVLYQSPQELMELIDYYLAHEDARRRIAELGYQETLTRHTYGHRVARMLDAAAGRLGAGVAREPAASR